jgi:transposase-like protein
MNGNNANVINLDPVLFEKERQVVQYRQSGATFDAIAKKLDYANESSARAAFKRAMERMRDDVLNNEMRELHRQRLETALMAIWPDVVKGDLEAIKVMLKILERDAKLYGIDAPVKTEVEVTSYDGNLLRERTREIVRAIREVRKSEDSLGDGSSETGTVTE